MDFDPTLLESEDFVLKMIEFLKGWSPPTEIESPDVVWELKELEEAKAHMISEDGTEVFDVDGILRIGKEFYEKLYASQEETLDPMEGIEEALA